MVSITVYVLTIKVAEAAAATVDVATMAVVAMIIGGIEQASVDAVDVHVTLNHNAVV